MQRFMGLTTGLSVCEDAWHDSQPFAGYAGLPLIVNINGSPYHRGKTAERAEILAARARQTGAWIAYVNAVGGQDELVFDGGSMMVAPDGTVRHRAAAFEEDLLVVDLHGDASFADHFRHRHGVVQRAAGRVQPDCLDIFAPRLDLGGKA